VKKAPNAYNIFYEAMKKKKRISRDEEPCVWKSPFAALKAAVVPPASEERLPGEPVGTVVKAAARNRGRVDIIRQTAHRGGKTVTVVSGFTGISLAEKEQLAKAIQKTCGAGGTVKEGRIEIQGDQRAAIAGILTKAGFRPVFAGG
jgi:translation initiation factor 1